MRRILLLFVVALTVNVVFAQKPDTVINGIGFKKYGVEVSQPGDIKSINIMLPVPNGNKALRAICDFLVGPNYDYVHFQEQLEATYLAINEESATEEPETEPEVTNDTATDDSEFYDEFEDFDYERIVLINPIAVYDDFIMYMFYQSEYTGGIHPFWGTDHIVFDLHTGKELKEEDIFDCTEANVAAITLELRKKLTEYVGEDVEDYGYTTMLNGNFYFDKNGLTYTYVPYEVVWYAAGEPELTLSKNFLKPYLKKDGPLYNFWFGK